MSILEILKDRFHSNIQYHPDISWEIVESRLDNKKLKILQKMEETGGNPDLLIIDNRYIYCDLTPKYSDIRLSLCYDKDALDKRKTNKPKSNVLDEVKKIGSNLVDEDLYYKIQEQVELDLKTTCWLATPNDIRKLGGAIFGNKSYGRVFIYHNGAMSYYSSRGFRTYLEI